MHLTGRLRGPGVVRYESYKPASSEHSDAIVAQHDGPAAHLALNDTWRAKGYKHWVPQGAGDGRKAATAEGPVCKRLRKSGFIELRIA